MSDVEPTARHPRCSTTRPSCSAWSHAVQPGVGHDHAARRRRAAAGHRARRRLRRRGLRSATRSSAARSASSPATSTQPALHSHITGILPGVRRTGLGRAMKLHQRAWAADHGLAWVTWTFDPLVRRNAWFNLDVLGAEVHEYLVDFYGPIDDAINAGDESDRLLVAWAVRRRRRRPSADAGRRRRSPCRRPRTSSCCAAPTPPTPTAWRRRVRAELGGPLAAGAPRRRLHRATATTVVAALVTARDRRAARDPPPARQPVPDQLRRADEPAHPARAGRGRARRRRHRGLGRVRRRRRADVLVGVRRRRGARHARTSSCRAWHAVDDLDRGRRRRRARSRSAATRWPRRRWRWPCSTPSCAPTGARSPTSSASSRDRIPSGVSVGIHPTIDDLLAAVAGLPRRRLRAHQAEDRARLGPRAGRRGAPR